PHGQSDPEENRGAGFRSDRPGNRETRRGHEGDARGHRRQRPRRAAGVREQAHRRLPHRGAPDSAGFRFQAAAVDGARQSGDRAAHRRDEADLGALPVGARAARHRAAPYAGALHGAGARRQPHRTRDARLPRDAAAARMRSPRRRSLSDAHDRFVDARVQQRTRRAGLPVPAAGRGIRRRRGGRDHVTATPQLIFGPTKQPGPVTEEESMSIVNRRDFWQALAASSGAVLLPNGAFAQGTPKQGGTLVMDVLPEPPTLASYLSTSGPIGQVSAKVYDGLCEYNFDLKPIPSLATSWTTSTDGKTITFKLRDGVKFHDGSPLTSADVQFTFMDVLKKFHPRGINTFRALQAVDAPDPHTAVFHLDTPAPYMMMALSGYESPIVPKALFAGTDIQNSKYANNPVGTGPFKFVEWQRGQYMRFDRNPGYWRPGQPHLDRIVARFIGDAQTRSAAMQTQEINYGAFGAIPYFDVARLTKIPSIA